MKASSRRLLLSEQAFSIARWQRAMAPVVKLRLRRNTRILRPGAANELPATADGHGNVPIRDKGSNRADTRSNPAPARTPQRAPPRPTTRPAHRPAAAPVLQ